MKDLLEQVAEIEEKLHGVEIHLTPFGLGKGAEELIHHLLEGRRGMCQVLNHLKHAATLLDAGHGRVSFEVKTGGGDDAVDR